MARRLFDAQKYAVLAAAYSSEEVKHGTQVNHADVGGYRTKTVRAGDFLYISCYPLISCNASCQQRRKLEDMHADSIKDVKLRAKYTRYNNHRRCTEFEQMVHANMVEGDLHICCTYGDYDKNHLTADDFITREQAKKDIRNYLRRLRYLLKRHGCSLKDFRWICVTVTKSSKYDTINPLPDSHHHHLLVHGVPDYLRKDAEELWQKGQWNAGTCNADRLQESYVTKHKGFSAMANYVARQESSFNGENAGERSYTTSRNIIRPTVTTSDSRLSRRRAAMIAADVRINGHEIFEKLFDGYRLTEDAKVIVSDFTAGAYIYARLRRIDNSRTQNRPRRTPSRMIA